MPQTAAINAVRELLHTLRPRNVALELADLVVHPIEIAHQDGPTVLHVREALAQKIIEIEELRSPRVPSVTVINHGEIPVFFPAGAVLKGGAQTRIVATPSLVLGNAQARIPVRCVESGRWTTHRDRVFHGVSASPLQMKSAKHRRDVTARQSRLERAADQGETWHHVSEFLAHKEVTSPTQSLIAAMDRETTRSRHQASRRSPVEQERAQQALDGAAGLAVSDRKSGWVAWDVFGVKGLAEQGVRMALESVEVETGDAGRPSNRDRDTINEQLRLGLDTLAAADWTVRSEGPATLVDFSTSTGTHGTALVYEGVVLQATLSWDPASR